MRTRTDIIISTLRFLTRRWNTWKYITPSIFSIYYPFTIKLQIYKIMHYMSSLVWHLSMTVSPSLSVRVWYRRCRSMQFYSLSIIIRDISLLCYLWCARCHLCLQSRSALIDHPLDQYSANKWDNRPVMSAGQRLQTITVQRVNKIVARKYGLLFISQGW